jgi:hypothetical protein
MLELERGEDIDLVGRLISASGTTEGRLLEQIKHRETNISLRTPAALEALANFHDHRINNAGADLRFCFLTNATVGREQLNPFPNRVPGITLWEQVRAGQLDNAEANTALEHLRRFLANSAQPKGLAEPVWSAWKEYLATAKPTEFREFAERFEWATGQPNAEQQPVALRGRLLALEFARDESDAVAMAERLFMHVARMLAAAGLKRLTIEDRAQVLTAPTLPAQDRALLAQLRTVVTAHSDRLESLEADVSALGSRVETLFLAGTTERIELTVPVPDLSLPPTVVRLSPRRSTAEGLCRSLTSYGWLALHGGPDVGKSQLALQIVVVDGRCRGWMRFFHAQPTPGAARHLDAALTALADWKQVPRRAEWYEEALMVAGSGSLIVLDDLPRISADDAFAEQLLRLAQAARAADVRMISTSHFELPARLKQQLGNWVNDRPTPPFTDEEAADLLRAHGAPDSLLSERPLRFLNSHAAGHPLLLTATAEFLAARGWKYREDELIGLLRGDHTQAILPEVINRLTRTIGDPPRELLYRLTLPFGSFDQTELVALAGVAPPVDRPRECLTDLRGAWVQRDTDSRFAVSPLVRPLGGTELEANVRSQCYRELAEIITRRRVMNPFTAEQAILYNLEAGELERAALLYVLLLIEALKKRRRDYVVPIIDKWRNTPLPGGMSVSYRLFVRAYQLAAFIEYGLETRFVVRDIDRLLDEATDRDGWGIVAVAAQSLRQFRKRDPDRVLSYVRRALELPAIYRQDGNPIVLGRVTISDMLWMLVTDLRTTALLRKWLDVVEALPQQHSEPFWGSDVGRQAVWIVPNRIYTIEWDKPKAKQDWNGLLQELSDILARVRRLQQPRLEAAMTGLMIEILGERKRLDEAPAIAEATLSRWSADPTVQLKVRGTLGRQYAYQKRDEAALPLLDAALAQVHGENNLERVQCLMAANLCVGPHELRYAEQARELARTAPELPPIEAARALGEYAISVFLFRGGKAGALSTFAAWSETMRRFLGVPQKDRFWRDLFPLFAHVTGYLASMGKDGCPPPMTADGGPFLAPERGALLRDYMREREALYRESGEAAIAVLMGSFAAITGDSDEAAYWMRLAGEESRRIGASFLQIASGKAAIGEMVATNQFEDAVETGLFVGRGLVVDRAVMSAGDADFAGIGVDISAEFRKLPEDKRRLGDYFALISGALPTAIGLIRLSLSDPEKALVAGQQVAALCRQLTEDEWGDHELWRTAAQLFESSSVANTNAHQIIERARAILGNDERAIALRVLGHVLATWHASPDQAILCQLSVMELLLKWFRSGEPIRHRVVIPCIESYWQHAAREQPFAFRVPGLTIPSIEAAAATPEDARIPAILSAVANGLGVPGAYEILQRIRAICHAARTQD